MPRQKTKVCKGCGKEKSLTCYDKQPDSRWGHTSRCKVCRSKAQKDRINNNREKHRATRRKYENKKGAKQKQKAVDYKGGKCSICGYHKCFAALEFHHINPGEKEISISSKWCSLKWGTIQRELDKCILVCANCHREIHHVESL